MADKQHAVDIDLDEKSAATGDEHDNESDDDGAEPQDGTRVVKVQVYNNNVLIIYSSLALPPRCCCWCSSGRGDQVLACKSDLNNIFIRSQFSQKCVQFQSCGCSSSRRMNVNGSVERFK